MKKYITKNVYFFLVFELFTYKKRENGYKALYTGKPRDIARKVYNKCFIVQKNHKAKNAKKNAKNIMFGK